MPAPQACAQLSLYQYATAGSARRGLFLPLLITCRKLCRAINSNIAAYYALTTGVLNMPVKFPRWLLIGLLTLALLAASFTPAAQGAAPPTGPAAPAAPAVQEQPAAGKSAGVESGPAMASVGGRIYEGFTRPSCQTAVASRVAGLVEQVLVVEGESVKCDQPLLQLDATAERLEVELSRMTAEDTKELEAAKLVASQSASELQRAQALLARSAITENELEQRQLALKVAELRVKAAESACEMARLRHQRDMALLQQRTITAPGDGIVLRVLKQKGEEIGRAHV